MSEARDTILQRIRSALADVEEHHEPPAPTFRRLAEGDQAALIVEFAERAGRYKVAVERAPQAEARSAIARILAVRGHVHLVVPDDLPDAYTPEGFDLHRDQGLDNTTLAGFDGAVATCACAIAQTGTIVLDHGPGQGRRVLTLLPDYFLCVVPADAIVGLVPEAVTRMKASVEAGRPLTFISGPSATSDIELNRVEGVHGPRTLDVLVVE